MPTNKKEGIIFTTLMCALMVIGMSSYNLVLHQAFSLKNLLTGLAPGFIVAFILDVFVVGVVAKKLVFSLPTSDRQKPITLILMISTLMVIRMVTFMSVFGLVMEGGLGNFSLQSYFQAWKMNFVAVLPYQLLVVGPFSRFILGKIQEKAAEAEVE